jgi:hypothetical protein
MQLLLLLSFLLATNGFKMSSILKNRKNMSLYDFPLIPAIGLSALGIFAIFNIENKVDLTDEGIYKMKKAKRDARIARGDVLPKKDESADPFAYKLSLFDDDEDEIEFPKKKSGGGCG